MKIRNLFLPIFAAFFLSGCGFDPEDVAEDYIKAIFDRDYKETYNRQ